MPVFQALSGVAMYRLIGAGLAVGFIAIGGAVSNYDKATNYDAVEAEVFRIDRTCVFVNKSAYTRHSWQSKDDCSSTDEFSELRVNHDQDGRKIQGTMKVKVSYTAPADQSLQTGVLEFDGHDEPFYKLNAHDKIKILVNKKDSSRIKPF